MLKEVLELNERKIIVSLEIGAIHIVNDDDFKKYLYENKLAAMKLSKLLRDIYKRAFDKEFKVSRGSMFIEIYAHFYPGELMKWLIKKRFVPEFIKRQARKVLTHTDVIDIGENDGIQRIIFDPLGKAVNIML